jgi:hypothetical protein
MQYLRHAWYTINKLLTNSQLNYCGCGGYLGLWWLSIGVVVAQSIQH